MGDRPETTLKTTLSTTPATAAGHTAPAGEGVDDAAAAEGPA